METKMTTRPSASDVNFNLIQDTLINIEAFVKKNDYQFKTKTGFSDLTESKFKEAWNNLSLKKRKKLAAMIWVVNNNITLAKANKFLHFLFKTVLNSDERVRIVKSEKEIAIEQKRKAYKDALAAVRKAYAEYKEEKGDFYKIRLAQNKAA